MKDVFEGCKRYSLFLVVFFVGLSWFEFFMFDFNGFKGSVRSFFVGCCENVCFLGKISVSIWRVVGIVLKSSFVYILNLELEVGKFGSFG